MKTWKIIAVLAFAVIAVALITTTALAYYANGQDTYAPYGSQGPRGGMMGGPMGGHMGAGNPTYGGYQYPNSPQQSLYPQQYGPGTNGYGGCPMRNGPGWP